MSSKDNWRGVTWVGSGSDMRFERAARERRERAHAHLERVRSERREDPAIGGLLFPARGVAVAVSVAAGVLLAGAPWAERLDSIHVLGAERLSAAQVAEATGVERGAPLGSVDPRAVAARLAREPWISEARVLRLPTGRLLLDVTERVPVAVLDLGEGTSAFVDASGTPFASRVPDAPADAGALPRIVSATPVVQGEPSEPLAEAVRLAERLPALGLESPTEVSIAAADDPVGFALRLPSLPPRVVLGREDLDARLSQLAMLLESESDELAGTTELDLRFAGQAVLRSGQRPKGAAQAAAARGRARPSKPGPSG